MRGMPRLASAIIAQASSEKRVNAGADRAEAKADVFSDLVLGQRLEVKVRRYPLSKLEQLRPAKHFLQLRLSNEDQLQILIFVDIDIRQHPKAFEGLLSQILRFVDDQYRPSPLRVLAV